MTTPTSQKADLEQLLSIFKTDIGAFSQHIFGRTLRPKQLEFANAFRDNRQIAMKGGTGFGKTATAAILIWWSLVCFDEVGVTIFAPNEGQIKSGIWKEVQQLYSNMHPLFKPAFDVTQTKVSRITAPAACYCEYRLANKDNPSAARGIHNTNNFIIVDEATGVDDEVFTGALINILTDPNPKLCLISNPSRPDGYFWRVFNDETISHQWSLHSGSFRDNPSLTPEAIENLTVQYGGVDSRQYRILMEGEFPLDSAEGLIPRSLIDMAVDNEDVVLSDVTPYIWGVDPAKGLGRDRSVLVIRNDRTLTDIKTYADLNEVQFAYALSDLYQKLPVKKRPIYIAVDGIGSGLPAILKDFGLPVKDINVAKKPTRTPEKYFNLRSQLWWECKEWFANENVRIPNNDALISELTMPTYNTDGGKIKVEGKQEMRKRLSGKSPDIADALCLTFAVSTSRFSSKYSWSKPIIYDNLSQYE